MFKWILCPAYQKYSEEPKTSKQVGFFLNPEFLIGGFCWWPSCGWDRTPWITSHRQPGTTFLINYQMRTFTQSPSFLHLLNLFWVFQYLCFINILKCYINSCVVEVVGKEILEVLAFSLVLKITFSEFLAETGSRFSFLT